MNPSYHPVGDPTKDLKQWPNGSVREARLEALTKVRELLDNETGRSEHYICYALTRIRHAYPHLTWACDDLNRLIKRGLDGCSSLQCWITEKMFGLETIWMRFPDPYKNDYYFNRGVMWQARLAWIDRLIENEKEAHHA